MLVMMLELEALRAVLVGIRWEVLATGSCRGSARAVGFVRGRTPEVDVRRGGRRFVECARVLAGARRGWEMGTEESEGGGRQDCLAARAEAVSMEVASSRARGGREGTRRDFMMFGTWEKLVLLCKL